MVADVQAGVCWLCGKPLSRTAQRGTRYCFRCKRTAQSERFRRYYYRRRYGTEPPPRQTTCVVCGKPLPRGSAANRRLCSAYCEQVRNEQHAAAHYQRHPEAWQAKLERAKQYRRENRAKGAETTGAIGGDE